MKLYMSDLYRVEARYPLDEVQNDILYYLYQPLIGSQALSTYMILYTEGKRMGRFLKPSSLSRITSFLSYQLMDLEKQLQILEAIGLLKTYVKHQQVTQYVFKIQSPLSLQAFFKNQILSSLLQESLSREDFQKTIQYFQCSLEDIQDYEEITSSFTDVFTISQHHQRTLKIKDDLKEKQTQDIHITYDMSLLKRALQDYQVPQHFLSDSDFQYIGQLGTVYSIDAMTLAGMIKDAFQAKTLDKKRLKQLIQNYCEMDTSSSLTEVYHKQPIQYQTSSQQQDPLSLHMKYLDSLTPYELLKEKQGGSEPVIHDLMIIETLMVQLGLKPAVVNVLIEYVLGKNNNRLSKRYCEAIGSSWARKHIETAMAAYQELMNDDVVVESNEEQPLTEDFSDVDEQKLNDLLHRLKEGQL